jgi:hypothetical protein
MNKPLIFSDLMKYQVSRDTNHPASGGMILALMGLPKSGKTTIANSILQTVLSSEAIAPELLSLESILARNQNVSSKIAFERRPQLSLILAGNRNVVYLDFEGHISTTQEFHNKLLAAIDRTTTPDNLHIFNLSNLSIDERKQAIYALFQELDPHSIVVDEIGHLVSIANDEEESNCLLGELLILTSKHNTCLIVLIRTKGTGGLRDHLASGLERKGTGVINLNRLP